MIAGEFSSYLSNNPKKQKKNNFLLKDAVFPKKIKTNYFRSHFVHRTYFNVSQQKKS